MFPRGEPTQALQGFEVLERLGAGGAGEVYLARSRRGRLVAIKTLRSAAMQDASQLRELAREASMCSRLSHPAIVQLRAFVEEPGFAALVFEYVPGVALVRVLRECASRGVRLPDRAAFHIVERVTAALACAHAQRDDKQQPAPIVHRDVSPANVLLAWDGDAKLADFGMATMLGVSPNTRLGLVKGTLGCMAPEQARGERVTERADVYAAALMAVGLATGRSPFARFLGDERELVRAMRSPKLRPLAFLRPDLPEALTRAIDHALEPDPAARTITAEELRQAIASAIDCDGGEGELGELLASWRSSLASALTRSEPLEGAAGAGQGLEPRDCQTSRYEEVALAFADDDAAEEAFSLRESLLPPAVPDGSYSRKVSSPRAEPGELHDDELPLSPAPVAAGSSPRVSSPPAAADEARTVPTVRPAAVPPPGAPVSAVLVPPAAPGLRPRVVLAALVMVAVALAWLLRR